MKFNEIEKPTARAGNLVTQELGDEILIYDLDTNKAYHLNETSSFVWQNCDGLSSIADLSFRLGRKANQPVKDEVVWLALTELKKNQLIDYKIEAPQELTRLSRREAIKSVGLASMIALPLVTSLVAPIAASAASAGSVPVGGKCQDDRDCRQNSTNSINCNPNNCPVGTPATSPATKCCG